MKTPKLDYQFIKGEVQTERSYDDMEKLWKDYAKKMMDSTPDPVVSAKNSPRIVQKAGRRLLRTGL